MDQYDKIGTIALLKTIYVKLFGNRFFMSATDIVMTTIISIHTAKIDLESNKWINTLYLYTVALVLLNFLFIIADILKNKSLQVDRYFSNAYDVHNTINCKTANNLYRVNKKITEAIRTKKIEKGGMSSIADFQNLSFFVCNELYNFITRYCNCKECEITVFQRFVNDKNKEYVKMIAYKNSKSSKPSSYNEEFTLIYKKGRIMPVFISIFKNPNADVKILHNKRAVKQEFKILHGSESRESNICQYIGIPIKTNRDKVEVILQIDVSEKNVFGRTYNSVKQFTDYIIIPFCNLLYCSYERDLILNKFYDILEENIKKE